MLGLTIGEQRGDSVRLSLTPRGWVVGVNSHPLNLMRGALIMLKTKKRASAICSRCGSSEAMYVSLKNGDRLPSYAINLSDGSKSCHPCRNNSQGV